jgi:hypothetical protein
MPLTTIPSSPLLATASTPGAMPAEDKAKLTTLAAGGWLDGVALSIPTIAPGVAGSLRHYTWIRPADLITGLTASNNGNGAVVVGSAGWVALGNRAVLAMGGNPWVVAFRAKIPAPATGKTCGIGLQGGSSEIFLGNYYDIGGSAQTQLMLQIYAGGASEQRVYLGVSDPLAYHTYVMGWDGASLRSAIDGVVLATTVPNSETFPTSSSANLSARCTSGFGLEISDCAYAL